MATMDKENLQKMSYHENEIGKPKKFREQETKLLNLFMIRRAQGLRVTHKWLLARFQMILKFDKPEDWETYKSNTTWTFRFCKRHKNKSSKT